MIKYFVCGNNNNLTLTEIIQQEPGSKVINKNDSRARGGRRTTEHYT